MTQPKRPTKEPKPIGQHPHAGQYQVVASFRVTDDDVTRNDTEGDVSQVISESLEAMGYTLADLDVAVRVIGAGGEASEHEIWPPFGPLARTEDDVTVERAPLRETIDPGGRL